MQYAFYFCVDFPKTKNGTNELIRKTKSCVPFQHYKKRFFRACCCKEHFTDTDQLLLINSGKDKKYALTRWRPFLPAASVANKGASREEVKTDLVLENEAVIRYKKSTLKCIVDLFVCYMQLNTA
ncbi:hypothetical protein SADUNF_Sadunf09G0024300 [Salix dunnii]|uniref:Uncharacterized protein n=1 Tax=Salix dunnii TaxID=1413687 RepID=A0A835JQ65_9ROSI|nr:hypothetical protein SADUNF_Sadunf09G0024300 [Salix dunnii]